MQNLRKVAPWVFVVALIAGSLLYASRGETARQIWMASPATGIGTDTTTMVAPNGYYFGSFKINPQRGSADVIAQRWQTSVSVSHDGTNYNNFATYTDSFVTATATLADTLLSANLGAVRALKFRTTYNDSCTLTFQASVLKAGD